MKIKLTTNVKTPGELIPRGRVFEAEVVSGVTLIRLSFGNYWPIHNDEFEANTEDDIDKILKANTSMCRSDFM